MSAGVDGVSELSEERAELDESQLEDLAQIREEIELLSKTKQSKDTRVTHEGASSWGTTSAPSTYENELFDVTTIAKSAQREGIPLLKEMEAIENKPVLTSDDIAKVTSALSSIKEKLANVENSGEGLCEAEKELRKKIELFDQNSIGIIDDLESIGTTIEEVQKNQEKDPFNSAGRKRVNLCYELLHKAGIPKIKEQENQLKELSKEVEKINHQREALLDIKKGLAKGFDKDKKKYVLSDEMIAKIDRLKENGLSLIDLEEGQKELTVEQHAELKEQVSNHMSKLQTDQQMIFTTKINPLLTERNIVLEILKTCVRIYSRLIESILANKVQ